MTLLVTGRILGELQKVAGQLHFVDGVVAENGAVLHFPDSGHTSVLAPPTSDAFLDELRRRGIVHTAGQCLVDTDASEAPRLLQVIHKLELPLVTCESNPAEVEALCRCCSKCDSGAPSRWSMLGHLKVGQAVALPITEEAGGDLRLFTIGPRITPHARHREKYVDVPVTEPKAFVFGGNGLAPSRPGLCASS